MDIKEIRAAVQATIESVAPGTEVQRIRPDRPLREQLDLDSMDWLNVIVELHHRVGIEIPESDYGRLETLETMVAYVASRRAEPAAEPRPAAAAAPAALPSTSHIVNGTAVTVRPIRPEDTPLEADFVRHLSSDARYNRFMLTLRELSQAKLRYLTDVDQVRHVALLATVDREGRQVEVGVARYIVDAAGTGCEFAIAVDDAWQGCGLAGILMRALMDVARSRRLATMEGIVLATNDRMLRFMRQLGFALKREPEDFDTFRVVRSL